MTPEQGVWPSGVLRQRLTSRCDRWQRTCAVCLGSKSTLPAFAIAPGEYLGLLEPNGARLRRVEDAGPGQDGSVLRLTVRHQLSAYDASYLALAGERALPLEPLDTPR